MLLISQQSGRCSKRMAVRQSSICRVLHIHWILLSSMQHRQLTISKQRLKHCYIFPSEYRCSCKTQRVTRTNNTQPSTTETEEWPGDTMNSTLHMCQRMCEVQEPLNATIVVLMNPVECLTTEEWQALNIHTAAAANPWMQRGHCMPAARHLLYVDWLSGLRRQYKRRHTSKMSSSNSGRVAWTDDWQAGRHTNKRPIARSSYCCLSSLSDAKI